MSRQSEATCLDPCFKPGSYVYWGQHTYQVEPPAVADPLTIWLKDVETDEIGPFSVTELLVRAGHQNQLAPIFAPTLAKLNQARQAQYLPKPPAPTSNLPQSFLKRAEAMIELVEAVEQSIRTAARLAVAQGQKKDTTTVMKQACAELPKPIRPSTYYKYRKLYRQHHGDRIQLSQAQLHFLDTLILRFYAGTRTVRLNPHKLYELAGSILARTGQWWLDPDQCPGEGVENVIEELLDPRLPMAVILANPEKAGWLTKISLPSQSWFYGYLRWFEAQPDQGQEVIIGRHGEAMWEREFMVFDAFVHRAVRPLAYVFADHWLLDLFIVDEATRRRLDRLWLTLLLDAYSRSVVGLALLYEGPCIESIQSALRHAIWPKTSHQALGLNQDWICYGIPQQLFLDNAWAHHSHSLAQLSRAISQGGQYNSIDLVFRPPYRGRYGALIERLFGNFSGQFKELLPGAIRSSAPHDIQNAARQACLLYQDVYRIVHHLIVRYQHTPHRELAGLTPHQKWLEGWQLGYGGWPPPLTEAVERLFWRRSPETRVISRKGISAFGLHYWSAELEQLPRKDVTGQPIHYGFSYEPDDISRLALFQEQQWLGDVAAKELRRADGSLRPISLWERKMAQALARDRGEAGQDWLEFVTELNELEQQRVAEKRKASRQAKAQPTPTPIELSWSVAPSPTEVDYTDLLLNFVGEPTVENSYQTTQDVVIQEGDIQ